MGIHLLALAAVVAAAVLLATAFRLLVGRRLSAKRSSGHLTDNERSAEFHRLIK